MAAILERYQCLIAATAYALVLMGYFRHRPVIRLIVIGYLILIAVEMALFANVVLPALKNAGGSENGVSASYVGMQASQIAEDAVISGP